MKALTWIHATRKNPADLGQNPEYMKQALRKTEGPWELGGLGEFSKVMQTRDAVEGLHNFRKFSQPPECLHEAIQTRKKSSVAFIKYF